MNSIDKSQEDRFRSGLVCSSSHTRTVARVTIIRDTWTVYLGFPNPSSENHSHGYKERHPLPALTGLDIERGIAAAGESSFCHNTVSQRGASFDVSMFQWSPSMTAIWHRLCIFYLAIYARVSSGT
jgi:hypothetical protein